MMRLKTLVKRLSPPILLDLYRTLHPAPIWKGIYPHIRNVPASNLQSRTAGWRTSAGDGAALTASPPSFLQEHEEQAQLALVAAITCRQNGGRLRVLDFGGGLGISYMYLRNSLHDCRDLEYHVVELEWAYLEGGGLFERDERIHFHRSMPDRLDLDIVHATEALQYVDDYASVLQRLCAYRAPYVLLSGIHAGNFPTYATAQVNVPGAVYPQWFLNLDEIIGIVNAARYRLIYKGTMNARLDQRNFPAALRLAGGPAALLFARSPDSP